MVAFIYGVQIIMDDSFGGMADDEFFLGYDAMIPEDDPYNYYYDFNILKHDRIYELLQQ